jgi:DNA-binding transcriptional ArsR family regulator
MDTDERLDTTVAVLADPPPGDPRAVAGRREIVAELAEPFAMSQPVICQHLEVRERAALITLRAVRDRTGYRRIRAVPRGGT